MTEDVQPITVRLPMLALQWLRHAAFERRVPMSQIVIAAIEQEKDGNGNDHEQEAHRRDSPSDCLPLRRVLIRQLEHYEYGGVQGGHDTRLPARASAPGRAAAARPAACKGVPDATVQKLVAQIMAGTG